MNNSPTFEAALAEVEQIVRALEDGATTLEEGLAKYERGVGLLKVCYGHLRSAESRITMLAGVDAEDKPVLKAFEHSASDGDEKSRRGQRGTPNSNSGAY
jgi:exodeoxyribonuclease VII small subunit